MHANEQLGKTVRAEKHLEEEDLKRKSRRRIIRHRIRNLQQKGDTARATTEGAGGEQMTTDERSQGDGKQERNTNAAHATQKVRNIIFTRKQRRNSGAYTAAPIQLSKLKYNTYTQRSL